MTCIAALVHEGRVYMGADSAASSGDIYHLCTFPKTFALGPFVLGFTWSFRMGQVLRYSFKPPTYEGEDLTEYMVSRFVSEWRSCTKKAGAISKDTNGMDAGGELLVGFRGALFVVQSDFSVLQRLRPYAAIGSGQPWAEASLFTTADMQLDPRVRIRFALLAAQAHSVSVKEPFLFLESERRP